MHRICIAMLALSFLLAGCVPATVSPTRPAPPTQRWSGLVAEASGLPDAAEAALPADWWTSLGDPVLNGLVDVALEDSLDLRAAAARVRQAHALVDAARANRMPRLDLNVNAERGVSSNLRSGMARAVTFACHRTGVRTLARNSPPAMKSICLAAWRLREERPAPMPTRRRRIAAPCGSG
ncbi:TolC family protein [Cupriavidus basilensis]